MIPISRTIASLLLGVVLLQAALTAEKADAQSLGAEKAGQVVRCTKPNTVAITWDDGPSKRTLQLLDTLKKYGYKTTLFVIGSQVIPFASILKRAYDEGHQIALHTFTHPHCDTLTEEELRQEAKNNMDDVERVIGRKPKYIRAPYGEANATTVAIWKSLGLTTVNWIIDTNDWEAQSPDYVVNVYQKFLATATNDPRFISLQHDLYQPSIDAAETFYGFFKSKPYKLTTVADCLGDSDPYFPGTIEVTAAPTVSDEVADSIVKATRNKYPTAATASRDSSAVSRESGGRVSSGSSWQQSFQSLSSLLPLAVAVAVGALSAASYSAM